MTTAQRLYEEALALPEEEREDLALRLLQSVANDEPIQLHPEWEAEAASQLDQLKAGTLQTVPLEEALSRIRQPR